MTVKKYKTAQEINPRKFISDIMSVPWNDVINYGIHVTMRDNKDTIKIFGDKLTRAQEKGYYFLVTNYWITEVIDKKKIWKYSMASEDIRVGYIPPEGIFDGNYEDGKQYIINIQNFVYSEEQEDISIADPHKYASGDDLEPLDLDDLSDIEDTKLKEPVKPALNMDETRPMDKLTKREYACIHLKMPFSNTVWLDDIIRRSFKNEM